ncbi:hypothetical protein CTI12_AA086060 [Artemisia annua]|uniref:Retrotransposon gag domain-containing protein n=1 Tax=Artemisia annua TaxID=35608 RepID=A0A2U1NRT9_ARTAN|nr:hypothetical protein CTI12_AA086060 [Artemisia annua]
MLPGLNANEVISRLVNDIRNGAGSSGGSGSGGGRPTNITGWLERFSKYKPLSFNVAANPQDAEDWITHMEKLFEVLVCEDEFKTRLATFKLKGDALNWWRSHKLAQGENNNPAICTWAEFRETFYKRYFHVAEQERFEREYNNIYQFDHENSGEYMRRFVRLASFVGPVAGDARRQAKHFKWGLKKWVLYRLLNTEFIDVAAVYDAARNIEIFHKGSGYKRSRDGDRIQHRAQGDSGRGDSGRGEYGRGFSGRGHDSRGKMDRGPLVELEMIGRVMVMVKGMVTTGSGRISLLGQRPTEVLPPPPLCPTCGKPHPGPCRKLTGECYRCGSNTYRVKDCPKGNFTPSANNPRLPAPSGRVFTTTRDQATGTSDF